MAILTLSLSYTLTIHNKPNSGPICKKILFLPRKKSVMTPYFEMLSESEYQQLKDALALITVYIAGADGSIDKEEMEWAEKVTEIRSYKMTDDLLGFYQELNADFPEKVNTFFEGITN